jgi:ABC-2 type transport system ATP-binding protein
VARLATELGAEVPKLTVTRPSLEDTYLSLIAPHLTATGSEPVLEVVA